MLFKRAVFNLKIPQEDAAGTWRRDTFGDTKTFGTLVEHCHSIGGAFYMRPVREFFFNRTVGTLLPIW